MKVNEVDVVIIGAGLSGMAAAHSLLKKRRGHSNSSIPIRLHVIEAHTHVGGRTRNLDVDTGDYDTATDNAIELGGTWVSPDHTAFLELCRELGVEVFRASFINDNANEAPSAPPSSDTAVKDEEEEEEEWPWWYWGSDYTKQETQAAKKTIFHRVLSGTQEQHETFSFCTPNELLNQMNAGPLQELERVGALVDEQAATVLNDLSWDATSPGAQWSKADSCTTSTRLLSALKTNEARNVLRAAIHTRNAQEPEQVGFLYNMLSFKGCNSTGPDSEYRVRGGTQAVPLAIAAKLGPERMTLGDPVQCVRIVEPADSSNDDPHHQVEVILKSGKVICAKALIVTGSPPSILGIDFEPPLPAIHSQLLQRMPMGTSRKFIAVYKRGPWWRAHGYSGDILASGLPKELSVSIGMNTSGDDDAEEERVPIFGQCFDTSPFSQEFGVLTCFVEGRQNLYFSNLSEEKQRHLMLQFLRLTFQDLDLRQDDSVDDQNTPLWEPDFFATHNWADETYARGAYTAYFPPGVLSVPEWWKAYRTMEKLPNVFLAGADYHPGFGNGYMEGAVRSGQEAADLVYKRLVTVESES